MSIIFLNPPTKGVPIVRPFVRPSVRIFSRKQAWSSRAIKCAQTDDAGFSGVNVYSFSGNIRARSLVARRKKIQFFPKMILNGPIRRYNILPEIFANDLILARH